MENKILINLLVPTLEESYNVYLPISKRVGNVIQLLVRALNELGFRYELDKSIALYNRQTGEKYEANSLIYETNIRNGSDLVLL